MCPERNTKFNNPPAKGANEGMHSCIFCEVGADKFDVRFAAWVCKLQLFYA